MTVVWQPKQEHECTLPAGAWWPEETLARCSVCDRIHVMRHTRGGLTWVPVRWWQLRRQWRAGDPG